MLSASMRFTPLGLSGKSASDLFWLAFAKPLNHLDVPNAIA